MKSSCLSLYYIHAIKKITKGSPCFHKKGREIIMAQPLIKFSLRSTEIKLTKTDYNQLMLMVVVIVISWCRSQGIVFMAVLISSVAVAVTVIMSSWKEKETKKHMVSKCVESYNLIFQTDKNGWVIYGCYAMRVSRFQGDLMVSYFVKVPQILIITGWLPHSKVLSYQEA